MEMHRGKGEKKGNVGRGPLYRQGGLWNEEESKARKKEGATTLPRGRGGEIKKGTGGPSLLAHVM